MSQLTQTIRRPFGQTTAPRAFLAALAATAVIAVVVAVLIAASLRPAGAQRIMGGGLLDGWMPAISAANAARVDRQAREATDGWAPAVTSALKAKSDKLASEVTDGWAGSLLK